SVRFQRGDKFGKAFFAPQLGIQSAVVADVVTVRTAGASAKVRRAIDVADAEFVQIGNDRGRLTEIEFAPQLQAISRGDADRALVACVDPARGVRWGLRGERGGLSHATPPQTASSWGRNSASECKSSRSPPKRRSDVDRNTVLPAVTSAGSFCGESERLA